MAHKTTDYIQIQLGDTWLMSDPKLTRALYGKFKLSGCRFPVFMDIFAGYNSVSKARNESVPYAVTAQELATAFGISLRIVQKALAYLEDCKLIEWYGGGTGRAANLFITNNSLINEALNDYLNDA